MRISTDIDAIDIVDLGPNTIEIVAIFDRSDSWIDIVDLHAGACGGMETVEYLEMGCIVDFILARQVLAYWVKVNRGFADGEQVNTHNTTTPARDMVKV